MGGSVRRWIIVIVQDRRELRWRRTGGGESLAVDEKGDLYLAAGQVFVYSPDGKLIDTIEVPERPSQLLFGGADGHTLFILARGSLYAAQTTYKGR